MTGISAGKAIGYATLPGIFPRLNSLFFSGFGNLGYFIALAYAMVRLLPAHHPYLNPANIGTYGVRHVIAAAMHELKFEWKHIDQLIVFFALLAGSAGLMMFAIGIIAFVIVSPVMAMSYFVTQAPTEDIAFMMLDKVFGLPGMFMSEVETNPAKYGVFPNNFHVGMRSLFQFYGMGLFLLSVFIFLYYVAVVVTETAVTGTPFGHRFDNIWIPLRVIGALALLMPGFGGYSSAQYIVLYAAKWGSGLATNSWITYNLSAGNNPLGLTNREIITRPALPDYTKLIKDLIILRGCMETQMVGAFFIYPFSAPESFYGSTEWMVRGTTAQPLLPLPPGTWINTPPRSPVGVALGIPFAIQYNNYATFQTAMTFYNGANIRLVLGTRSDTIYTKNEGFVYPHCGEVVIPITGQTREALFIAEGYMAAVIRIIYSIRRSTAPGALNVYEDGMGIASARDFYQSSASWKKYVQTPHAPPVGTFANRRCYWDSDNNNIDEFPRGGTVMTVLGNCEGPVPPIYWTTVIDRYQKAFEWAALSGYDYLTGAVGAEDMEYSIGDTSYTGLGDPDPMMTDIGVLRYGWGGAGLWYNKIAEKNGSLASAVGAAPYVVKYPAVMEQIKQARLKTDKKVELTGCEVYNPRKAGTTSINTPDERGAFNAESALSLYNLCSTIHENAAIKPQVSRGAKNTNMIMNMINALFGAGTFFNLLDNRDVHPMSMLSTLGRTLIDKAIFNMTAAAGTSVIGGINQLGPGKNDVGFAYVTIAAQNFVQAFVSFGSIALIAGVMLYYVMPFMPFMYFFFAVGRWVKSIFEAMVGVPLWALAHLSLKGPGLPSPAANAGYFLILEIFIRPVLTVLSLIAAFSTFAAMVMALNTIFDLAIANIFGADVKLIAAGTDPSLVTMRNLVDQFFLTVLYVIIVYIIGTSCFKLIDLIPDNIMRWSGAGVKSWGGSDNADELVDSSGQYMTLITRTAVNTMGEGIVGVSKSFSDDARSVIAAAERAKAPKTEAEKMQEQLRQQARSPSTPTPDPNAGLPPGIPPRTPATPQQPQAPAAAPLVPGATQNPAAGPGTGRSALPQQPQAPQRAQGDPMRAPGTTQTPQAPGTPQTPGTKPPGKPPTR